MIKIINERKKSVERFDSLFVGDTFLSHDDLYVKSFTTGQYNAFCLSSTIPQAGIFCDEAEVEPVNINIIIK